MDDKILAKLAEVVEGAIPAFDNDKVKFSKQGYEAVPISKDNFKEIKNIPVNAKAAFVDGGNAEIVSAANFSLSFLRIYGCIYEKNKKIKSIKKEFYVLVKSRMQDDIVYETEIFPVKGDIGFEKLVFDSNDITIKEGSGRADISKIAEIIRRFAELALAAEVVDKLSAGDLVVLDGSLQSSVTGESYYLEKLFEKCVGKNVVISGLAKTSRLFTDKGNSVIGLLNELGPEQEWYYHPVAKITNEKHKAEMFFIKLNKAAEYIFRFEVCNKQEFDINKILNLLVDNSKDPVFPGYPYGLLVADKFARISNNEKEYIRTIVKTKSGKNWAKIKKYANSFNAHSILDNIG